MVKDRLSLRDAYERLVRYHDSLLGVTRRESEYLLLAPGAEDITRVLNLTPGVKFYGDKESIPARSLIVPTLGDLALSKAHSALTSALHDGELSASGRTKVFEKNQEPNEKEMTVPSGIWGDTRRIRRQDEPEPEMPTIFPDYSRNFLRGSFLSGSTGYDNFADITIDAHKLDAYFTKNKCPPRVESATFRFNVDANGIDELMLASNEDRETLLKKLKVSVDIDLDGSVVILDMSIGLAAIMLLLAQPGNHVGWETLYDAAGVFRYGAWPPKSLDRDGYAPAAKSGVTYEEVRWLARDRDRNLALAEAQSGVHRSELLREAAEIANEYEKKKNARRRTVSDYDNPRQKVYHSMEQALCLLAVKCPQLVRHLGTLQVSERRAFRVEDGAIKYDPKEAVDWTIEPSPVWLSAGPLPFRW